MAELKTTNVDLPGLLGEFWAALGDQRQYYETPTVPWDDPIYCIRTRPGCIFDDQFWGVFVRFPFVVCHVAYYGPERFEESRTGVGYDLGIFELRWRPAVALKTATKGDRGA